MSEVELALGAIQVDYKWAHGVLEAEIERLRAEAADDRAEMERLQSIAAHVPRLNEVIMSHADEIERQRGALAEIEGCETMFLCAYSAREYFRAIARAALEPDDAKEVGGG